MSGGHAYAGETARLIVAIAVALALALAATAVVDALIGPPAPLARLP